MIAVFCLSAKLMLIIKDKHLDIVFDAEEVLFVYRFIHDTLF